MKISDNYMILNGERFPVINAWVETEAADGRKRWGIVTETAATPPCEAAPNPAHFRQSGPIITPSTEEQPPAAEATVITEANCMRRGDQHHPHAWLLNGHSYHCDGMPAAT